MICPDGRRGLLGPALVLSVILAAAYAALDGLEPPEALPETAPASEFSAARALKIVERLSRVPHAVSTAAHDEVLEALVDLWKDIGLEPEVRRHVLVDGKDGRAAAVTNVLARIAGTEDGKAVMLAAHYDSVACSPGAADDSAGTAALLETARALGAGPAPKHDIVFLVTDAEEMGLHGARAFVRDDPWAADIGLVLNFEARGSKGPSFMFETSPGNEALVRAFAGAAPRPVANSIAVMVYRHMPNGTDLTEFMKGGMQGLNFAFVEEPRDYHTPRDSVANLDLRSLQHHGSYALALARRFGETGIPAPARADAIYFGLLRGIFVVYSERTAALLACLSALFFAASGVVGFRKRLLRPGKLAVAALFLITALVPAPFLGSLFEGLVRHAHGAWLPPGAPWANGAYGGAVLSLLLLWFVVIHGLFRGKTGWPNIAFASAGLGVVLTAGLVAALPGASYITGIPSLAGTTVLLGLFLLRRDGTEGGPGIALIALGAFVTTLVFVPLLHFLFIALGFAPLGAKALSSSILLTLLALVPAVELLVRRGTDAWAILFLAGFLGFTVTGALTTRFTERHPRPSLMGYLLDMDTGRAAWFTEAGGPDAWTSRFMPAPKPGFETGDALFSGTRFIGQEAPAIASDPPVLERLGETPGADGRDIRFRVRSPRRALNLSVEAPDAEVAEAEMNGTPVAASPSGGKGFRFDYLAPGPEGYELRLKVKGGGPLSLVVREWSIGLPEIPGWTRPEPPGDIAPVELWTALRKTFAL